VELFFWLNHWFHGSSFFFPATLIALVAGLEEAKNPAGESPPPDSDLFDEGQVLKKSRVLVK